MGDVLRLERGAKAKAAQAAVKDGDCIVASDLKAVGIMAYDPGYMNTAVCTSSITYIDGVKGILRYRGFPIEQLAERSSFLEAAFLLLYGVRMCKCWMDLSFVWCLPGP